LSVAPKVLIEINIISKDTPFAFSRFCKANDVKNINTLSDYKGASNARKYGSVIASPKFLEEFHLTLQQILAHHLQSLALDCL
jgi:peroxiredoxin